MIFLKECAPRANFERRTFSTTPAYSSPLTLFSEDFLVEIAFEEAAASPVYRASLGDPLLAMTCPYLEGH